MGYIEELSVLPSYADWLIEHNAVLRKFMGLERPPAQCAVDATFDGKATTFTQWCRSLEDGR